MEPNTFVDLFLKYGSTPLFLALYLVAIYYCFRELKANAKVQEKAKEEIVKMTERVTEALDRSSANAEQYVKTMEKLTGSLDETRTQTGEFIAYLRGREGRSRP